MSGVSGICVRLNGQRRNVDIDHRVLLSEMIRDHLGALGTRMGCRTGDCGACTVFVDGQVTKSCLMLAVQADGCDIQTIEGCNDTAARSLQAAFVARNGFQCGFCTSGMIVTALALLRSNPQPTRADIDRAISGNLCRCTGYNAIVDSIEEAATAVCKQIT